MFFTPRLLTILGWWIYAILHFMHLLVDLANSVGAERKRFVHFQTLISLTVHVSYAIFFAREIFHAISIKDEEKLKIFVGYPSKATSLMQSGPA